jgi:hypothetical protein
MLGILGLVLIPSLLQQEIDAASLRPAPADRAGVCCDHGPVGSAGQEAKVRIEVERIYYGTPNAWTRAGVLDGTAIVRATAAWKEMERRGIRRGDPAYDLYKNRAEKEARAAIEKVAKNQRPPYDLIGEIGSIAIKGGVVPNLTDDVILELGS